MEIPTAAELETSSKHLETIEFAFAPQPGRVIDTGVPNWSLPQKPSPAPHPREKLSAAGEQAEMPVDSFESTVRVSVAPVVPCRDTTGPTFEGELL